MTGKRSKMPFLLLAFFIAYYMTSNRGFSEWGEVFGDTVVAAALLDRLLLTPERISGMVGGLRKVAALPDPQDPPPDREPAPSAAQPN